MGRHRRGDYRSAECERLSLRLAAVQTIVPELELHCVNAVEPEAEQHLGQLQLRDAEVMLQADCAVRKRVDATPHGVGADRKLVSVVGFEVDLMRSWR